MDNKQTSPSVAQPTALPTRIFPFSSFIPRTLFFFLFKICNKNLAETRYKWVRRPLWFSGLVFHNPFYPATYFARTAWQEIPCRAAGEVLGQGGRLVLVAGEAQASCVQGPTSGSPGLARSTVSTRHLPVLPLACSLLLLGTSSPHLL